MTSILPSLRFTLSILQINREIYRDLIQYLEFCQNDLSEDVDAKYLGYLWCFTYTLSFLEKLTPQAIFNIVGHFPL